MEEPITLWKVVEWLKNNHGHSLEWNPPDAHDKSYGGRGFLGMKVYDDITCYDAFGNRKDMVEWYNGYWPSKTVKEQVAMTLDKLQQYCLDNNVSYFVITMPPAKGENEEY